jgi:hypothetical protein
MEILRLNTHGIAIAHFSRMIISSSFFLFNSSPTYSSSLNEQVITTGNSSIYTFNVTRFDNEVKYECQIWNQALAIPLRIEQSLHVKCKHRPKKCQLPYVHRFFSYLCMYK